MEKASGVRDSWIMFLYFFFSQMNERKVDRRFLGRAYLLEKWGTSLSVGSWDLLVCFLVDALSEYL